jgi:hypothetical protein
MWEIYSKSSVALKGRRLNAEILLFAIKNSIKKIFINIWTQKKKEEKKKND